MDNIVQVIIEYKSGKQIRKKMTCSQYNIFKEECLRNENIEDVYINRKRK